jgi:circadian clock protein KaiC
VGLVSEVKAMLIRLIDFLQEEQITVMFTALMSNSIVSEQTDEGVSSLTDTWLMVRDIEFNGERNRGMYIMKSRGMKHSNQVREFIITDNGIDLVDVYLGPEGVLTGSAREAQKLHELTGEALRKSSLDWKDREIDRKRKVLEAAVASLQAGFESAEEELNKIYKQEELIKKVSENTREEMTKRRGGSDERVNKNKK